MRRVKRLLFRIFIIIFLCVAALAIWQWDNITVIYTAITNDTLTLEKELEETKQKNQQALEDLNIVVSAPSLAQTEALLNGELTSDEVKKALNIDSSSDDNQNKGMDTQQDTAISTGESFSSSAENTTAASTPEEQAIVIINACTAELYACQVDLMADLGVLYSDAKARWAAVPQKTSAAKQQFITEGLEQCYSIEASTDAKVTSILDKYRAQLKSINVDDSPLDQLWDIYISEKNAQKAYYLSKYMS